MKRLFSILVILTAVALNCITGSLVTAAVGVSPMIGAVGMNVVSLGFGCLIPEGSLGAGLYTEVWTGYMVKAMRTSADALGWYSKIKDFSQYAENDVIHFVHIGGDPTVLVNNTTYPIELETLTDSDKTVSLDKFQTKPTVITDDEVYALGYDKMASVIERHREALDQTKYSKAIHAIAPAANTSATPIILTTGKNDEGGTRRMINRKDIIAMKKKFDAEKVPLQGRILVLCQDHVADLLQYDQKFADQYYNYTTGKISNLYGFEIYEYQDCPYFANTGTFAKVAYGGSTNGKFQGSVAFYAPRMMKANGTTKTYLSEAKTNPQYQENRINFRTYSICLPLKNEAIGAIVSAPASVVDTTTIVASVSTLNFAAAGESLIVEVECPNNYMATISGTGFSKSKSGETVTVTASANTGEGATERTGTLTLKDIVSLDTITVALTQEA